MHVNKSLSMESLNKEILMTGIATIENCL